MLKNAKMTSNEVFMQSPPSNSNCSSADKQGGFVDEVSFVSFLKETLKALEMMRCHKMLTDVILEVGSDTYHAHRVVLAAASPYFKAMFTGGLKECEVAKIRLQDVSPSAMGRLLNFVYTGRIRVTENTVCQLLPAAVMLQISTVISKCCDFLENQLDPSNAIGIASYAEHHGCVELCKKANQYIEQNFCQICQEEEFFQLSANMLIALIKKDELVVQDEKEVYEAVLKWVKHNQGQRQSQMSHILSAVRCQFLPPKYLNDQMTNCPVIKQLPACKEYLARIFKDLTLHKSTLVKERSPNIPRIIFVAGGYLRQSLDILEGFNVDDNTWHRLDNLRVPRSGLGGAFMKGEFYAVGGRNTAPGRSSDSNWVDRYNPVKNQWRPCSPMSSPRNRLGVAVMDGQLYAVGGSDGNKYHNTVECYDPEVDRWINVKSMHVKRLAVGVAVVNRLLYAIGGYDGIKRHSSAEVYHPENDAWHVIASMNVPRSGAGVAAIKNYIYVIGGFDGVSQLNSVEKYDTDKNSWEFVSNMKIARSALSVTVLDSKIYAMGGYDGRNFSDSVEIYDPDTDLWSTGEPLTSGRSGHACASCFQPPMHPLCGGKT